MTRRLEDLGVQTEQWKERAEKEIQDMIDKRDKLREDRGKGLEERTKKEDRKREDMARLRTREEEQRNQVMQEKQKKRARGAAEACDLPIAGGGTSLPQSCTRSLGREEAEERQERKEEEVTPRPDCRALPVFGSLSLSNAGGGQRLLGFFVPHWLFVYLHIFEFFSRAAQL